MKRDIRMITTPQNRQLFAASPSKPYVTSVCSFSDNWLTYTTDRNTKPKRLGLKLLAMLAYGYDL